MTGKKITALLIISFICIFPRLTSGSIGYMVDTIDVHSYHLEDRITSRVILSKNSGKIFPAASTIKLATAIIAGRYLKGKSIVWIPRIAARVEPTKAYLRAGERYYASDLIKAMIVKSANDAAVALAVRISGNEKKFTRLMNRWCEKHKLTGTYFADASGLSGRTVSTAEDLTAIFKIFVSSRSNRELLEKKECWIKSLKGRKTRLKSSNTFHFYRNRMGGELTGKTGFTRKAGYCFTGMVRFRNSSYYITVMGASMAWHGVSILMNYANDLYTEKDVKQAP